MKVGTYITLSRDEINQHIPYVLVYQTISGSKWNTGRCKRLLKERFTDSERKAIYRMHKQAYAWYLRTGVPEELTITTHTLLLWQKLANFCLEL
jgi:hypothetical protein